jgi:hypothetical protein
MIRNLLLSLAAFAVAIASRARAEEAAPVSVLLETADGSILAGTLPAGSEFTLVQGGAETRVAVRGVKRMLISTFREKETASLEADVMKLRDRLGADDARQREEASTALAAIRGPIAPFVSALAKDPDPEVVARALMVLKALKGRGELQDSRDLVMMDKQVLRGWLKFDKLDLQTVFGPVTLARAEIRSLRSPDSPESPALTENEAEWPPPIASEPPKLPLQVVVCLRNGSRLVGLVRPEALALVDGDGRKLCSDLILSLVRDEEAAGFFKVTRKGVPVFKATLSASEVLVSGASRQWRVPVAMIDSLDVGKLRSHGAAGSMPELVQQWLHATEQGTELPTQRFWVYIDGQPANPWDSEGKKGMTWSLMRVHDQVALVGADKGTDAYKGDTSIEEALPILCVRKRDLPAPEGVDPNDFYAGWSGGEIRLTTPVAGTELTSLDAANAFIREQFGDEWEIGEHHSPNGGGWHWWGYWGEVPEDGK